MDRRASWTCRVHESYSLFLTVFALPVRIGHRSRTTLLSFLGLMIIIGSVACSPDQTTSSSESRVTSALSESTDVSEASTLMSSSTTIHRSERPTPVSGVSQISDFERTFFGQWYAHEFVGEPSDQLIPNFEEIYLFFEEFDNRLTMSLRYGEGCGLLAGKIDTSTGKIIFTERFFLTAVLCMTETPPLAERLRSAFQFPVNYRFVGRNLEIITTDLTVTFSKK